MRSSIYSIASRIPPALGLAIGYWLVGSLVFVRSGVSRRIDVFGWIGLSGWLGLSGQLLFCFGDCSSGLLFVVSSMLPKGEFFKKSAKLILV